MKHQNGSVLLISLIMLLILTVIGIASISGVTMSEKMANSQRDYDVAFEMAEAALVEGEQWVDANDFGVDAADMQSSCTGTKCWKSDCTNGLCFNGTYPVGSGKLCELTPPAKDVWKEKSYWDSKAKTYSLSVSGVEKPRYLIEFICYTPKDPSSDQKIISQPPDYKDWVKFYRITALGFGTNPDTRVMLQSTYRAE